MTLLNALAKLQTLGIHYYLQLTKNFAANAVVRETFAKLAQDLEKQKLAVQSLSRAFWKQFEEQQEGRQAATAASSSVSVPHEEETSLTRCCVQLLDFEEPLILQMYAPLIRHLRTQSNEQATELYIMAKAHVVRLTRLIQPFSGDPALVGRALTLLHGFEREVQTLEPILDLKVGLTAARKAQADAKAKEPQKRVATKAGRAASKSRAAQRTKPLVKKIVSRRRASG
jgi:hypothetical protein